MRSRVVIALLIACSSPTWPLAAQPSEQEAPPPAAEGDAPQLPEDDPAASASDAVVAAEAQAEPEVSVAPEAEPDEIVVTAQKRAQRVQDVPLSISVVGEFQLERQQVNRVADLARIAPSLEIYAAPDQNVGGGGSIRGLGTQSFQAGGSSAVGVVVDQVAQGSVNISDLFDVARVEVLKGPQGTLFGLTTSAGAINITTQAPDPSALSARLRTELSGPAIAGSRFGRQLLQGLINVPLGERAALRVSGNASLAQGVNRNALDDTWDQHQSFGGRARLSWEPSERLTLNLIGDYTRQNDDGIDFFIISRATPETSARLAACGVISADDREQSYCSNLPIESHSHSFGASAQVDYDFGPLLLTSISAYRGRNRGPDSTDVFRLATNPLQIFFGPRHGDSHLLSEELRVASPTGARFEYTAGVFVSRFEDTLDATPFTLAALTPAGLMPISPPSRVNPERIVVDTSMAVFGQATYRLIEQLHLIAGARLNHEQLSLEQRFVGMSKSLDTTVTNFSFKLGAQYEFSNNLMAYATVSRGYKGPQITAPDDPMAASAAVRPEIPMAYEAGVKGSVWGRALGYDLNAFYIELSDFQGQQCFAGSGGALVCTLANVSEITSQGVEADLHGTPLPGLSYNAGLIFNPVLYPDGYSDNVGMDLGGAQVAFAPRWKATLSAEYALPVLDSVEVFLAGDAVFKSILRLNTAVDPLQSYPQHWVVGGRLGARARDDRWVATLFVRNLLDEHEPATIYPNFPGMGEYGSIYTPNSFRQVGLSLDVRL